MSHMYDILAASKGPQDDDPKSIASETERDAARKFLVVHDVVAVSAKYIKQDGHFWMSFEQYKGYYAYAKAFQRALDENVIDWVMFDNQDNLKRNEVRYAAS